jgi:hypothetical protein
MDLIKHPEEGIQYLTNCTLATVDRMCMASNPPKGGIPTTNTNRSKRRRFPQRN